jgi:hypothetical protein
VKHFLPGRVNETPEDQERAMKWLLDLRESGKLKTPYRTGIFTNRSGHSYLYAEDDLEEAPGEYSGRSASGSKEPQGPKPASGPPVGSSLIDSLLRLKRQGGDLSKMSLRLPWEKPHPPAPESAKPAEAAPVNERRSVPQPAVEKAQRPAPVRFSEELWDRMTPEEQKEFAFNQIKGIHAAQHSEDGIPGSTLFEQREKLSDGSWRSAAYGAANVYFAWSVGGPLDLSSDGQARFAMGRVIKEVAERNGARPYQPHGFEYFIVAGDSKAIIETIWSDVRRLIDQCRVQARTADGATIEWPGTMIRASFGIGDTPFASGWQFHEEKYDASTDPLIRAMSILNKERTIMEARITWPDGHPFHDPDEPWVLSLAGKRASRRSEDSHDPAIASGTSGTTSDSAAAPPSSVRQSPAEPTGKPPQQPPSSTRPEEPNARKPYGGRDMSKPIAAASEFDTLGEELKHHWKVAAHVVMIFIVIITVPSHLGEIIRGEVSLNPLHNIEHAAERSGLPGFGVSEIIFSIAEELVFFGVLFLGLNLLQKVTLRRHNVVERVALSIWLLVTAVYLFAPATAFLNVVSRQLDSLRGKLWLLAWVVLSVFVGLALLGRWANERDSRRKGGVEDHPLHR